MPSVSRRAILQGAAAAAVSGLAGCGRSGGGAVSDSLLKLLPSDSVAAGGGAMPRIVESPLYTRFLEKRIAAELARLTAMSGLDPRKDIDEFVIASTGTTGLAAAKGRFVLDDLGKRLTGAGAKREDVAGRQLYLSGPASLAFLDATTAITGPESLVRATLVGSAGAAPKLRELVRAIPSQADLWAVSTNGVPPLPLPLEGNAANLAKVVGSLQSLTGWADLALGFQFNATGECGTPADAEKLYGAARAAVGLARLSTPSDRRDLLPIYDAIAVSMNGSQVRVSATLSNSQLDTLASLAR